MYSSMQARLEAVDFSSFLSPYTKHWKSVRRIFFGRSPLPWRRLPHQRPRPRPHHFRHRNGPPRGPSSAWRDKVGRRAGSFGDAALLQLKLHHRCCWRDGETNHLHVYICIYLSLYFILILYMTTACWGGRADVDSRQTRDEHIIFLEQEL